MNTSRVKLNHLVVEITSPLKSKGAVLLVPGLPQLLHKHPVADALCERGWEVWLPQLSGSWDSGGEFDPATHTKDLELLTEKVNNLTGLIGYSYGAGIAINFAKDNPAAKRTALIAPIVDYRAYADKAVLMVNYLKKYYPYTYRLNEEYLTAHLSGTLLNPIDCAASSSCPYLVMNGSRDPEIDLDTLAKFCDVTEAGHQSFDCGHKLDDFLKQPGFLERLDSFLENKPIQLQTGE